MSGKHVFQQKYYGDYEEKSKESVFKHFCTNIVVEQRDPLVEGLVNLNALFSWKSSLLYELVANKYSCIDKLYSWGNRGKM